MNTYKKKNPLLLRVPDPFDGSAQTRLIRMGVLDKDGQLDMEVMSVFAGIFAGLFFDDLCDFFDDEKDLLTIYALFRELYAKQDYQHMYLFMAIQYDNIRKPLPDPIWWLAGDNTAVKEFMNLFIDRYERFVTGAGFAGQEKEGEKK